MHSCVKQQYWVKHGLTEQIPLSSHKALQHLLQFICSFMQIIFCVHKKKNWSTWAQVMICQMQDQFSTLINISSLYI